MQVPQQFGSASSYGKKYALGNLFLIDDTQDSDAANKHGKAPKAKTKSTITSKKDPAYEKAVQYIAAGGKIEAIKAKYNLFYRSRRYVKYSIMKGRIKKVRK